MLKEKPPIYLRIWFILILIPIGFFGVLATISSLLLWPVSVILLIIRIRWSMQHSKQSERFETTQQATPPTLANDAQPSPVDHSELSEVIDPQETNNSITKYDDASLISSSDSKNVCNQNEIPISDEFELCISGWYISISFGKSSSQNYKKALTLAKAAPQYYEQYVDGNIIHQAFYSSDPSDYLAFIMLYELVGAWKSAFVIINGELIDRKIVGKLNYCYGDRCRSNNQRFCYGASYMTENPFGCHRLQISACNSPWWSFYEKVGNKYILNQQSMLSKINATAKVFRYCPCFDYDNILSEFSKLPKTLSIRKMKALADNRFGLKM